MCELMGMSANVPTDVCFSFCGLIQRGGGSGPHKDGWGTVIYEGKGVRCFHDPSPGYNSDMAEFLKGYPIKSQAVISHIRQANVGEVNLENTHPFIRELWGRRITYAHNGQLDGSLFNWRLHRFKPVGTTDSEYAFCWLIGQIETAFPDERPDPVVLHHFVKERCKRLKGLGVFNMLLSDGDFLMAFCSTKLSWITRKAPFGKATLKDVDMQIDFCAHTTPNDVVTVVATEPLTSDEQWQTCEQGELITFIDGHLLSTAL